MQKYNSDQLLYALSTALMEEYLILGFGMAKGCRCGGCEEYQLKDSDNTIVVCGDTLRDALSNFVEKYKDKYRDLLT